jgi:hypothetical protein
MRMWNTQLSGRKLRGGIHSSQVGDEEGEHTVVR